MSLNTTVACLNLSGATANVTGPDCENMSGPGATFVINITAITGTTPTATFTIEGKDDLSGTYYTILASAALNATGTTVLRVSAGLTAAANLTAVDLMPRNFRVRFTIGGTASPTVSATVNALLVG